MKVLFIDTSEKNALVALVENRKVLSAKNDNGEKTHATNLIPLVDKVLKDAGLSINDIDLFGVANGPGSYTGLRIAIATAEALAFGNDKLIVTINTLDYIAKAAKATTKFVLAMIDARNTLNFWRLYEKSGEDLIPVTDVLSDYTADVCNKVLGKDVTFVGSGSLHTRDIILNSFSEENIQDDSSTNEELAISAFDIVVKKYSSGTMDDFLPSKARAEYYKDVHVTLKKND